MSTLSYHDALAYLYGLTNYERIPLQNYSPASLNLDRMRDLLASLGNPHERYRTIHIAGTKGKGSTAAMMSQCLRQLGQRVGLYTSPHLTTFRERIQVSGEYIPADDVVRLTTRVKTWVDSHPGVTTFEAATAMGFLYFAEQNVDWAVIEVGLGGRLDATNVIMPQVSVITSLSIDHTKWLGHTLAEIAAEKAGIIKLGIPVVSHSQPAEAMAVIERIAHERQSPLVISGRHWRWTPGAVTIEKQSFQVKQVSRTRNSQNPFVNDLEGWYEIQLLGKHQADNATAVIAVMDVLRTRNSGLEIQARPIRDGLRLTTWPGRFEILRTDPPMIADGAHNIDSVNKLGATLAEVFPGRRWVMVFGCYKDKDAAGMLKVLGPRAIRWIMTQVDNDRATPVERLLEIAAELHLKAVALPAVNDAVDAIVNSKDAVCITGSIALTGAVRSAWAVRAHLPPPETD
ncbi:MAG TPA: folylpolyglutamate synthase/dihydrofolate synthase family protein [Anaerolineae bacterium]